MKIFNFLNYCKLSDFLQAFEPQLSIPFYFICSSEIAYVDEEKVVFSLVKGYRISCMSCKILNKNEIPSFVLFHLALPLMKSIYFFNSHTAIKV